MSIVAIVGLTGTAIGALVSGLLQIAQQKASGKITLISKEGRTLEIPSNTRTEDIDKLIEKLREMDIDKIILP